LINGQNVVRPFFGLAVRTKVRVKSLLSIRLSEYEFENAFYRETHLFGFAGRNTVGFLLETPASLSQVLGAEWPIGFDRCS